MTAFLGGGGCCRIMTYPMQLIYECKTNRCLPRGIDCPDGFNVTSTSNHWSNEEKAMEYWHKVIFPYMRRRKEELKLEDNQKTLLLGYVFKGQKT